MFRADTPTRSRTLTLLAAITMVVSIAQLAGAEEAATYFEEEKLSAPDATFNVHYGTFVEADEQTSAGRTHGDSSRRSPPATAAPMIISEMPSRSPTTP